MSMNNFNKIKYVVFIIISFFVFNVSVSADETCDTYSSQGQSVCEEKTYNGKKCKWDESNKDDAKCYDSGETAETITDCKQIKKQKLCYKRVINGYSCIWRQNACYSGRFVGENNTNENTVTEEPKETITDCRQIKEHEKCTSSEFDGHKCIWRQNACYVGLAADDVQNVWDKLSDTQIDKCGENQEKDKNGNCVDIGYVASDPCGEDSIKKVLRFFGYLLLVAKVVIPLIIIGFGTFDLFKSVVDKDEKSLGKQMKVLCIRIFTGIFVFFIPNLVYAVFGLTEKLNIIEQDKYKTCVNCLLKPTSECSVDDENSSDTGETTDDGGFRGAGASRGY